MKKILREWQRKKQRGAVSAVAVVLLLILIAGMVTATMMMSSSSINSSHQQSDQVSAMFLAESALERVVSILNGTMNAPAGSACAAVAADVGNVQSVNDGTLQIVSAVVNGADCDVRVRGDKGSISTFIDATIQNFGGVGGSAENFVEPFPSSADFGTNWTVNYTSTDGSSGYDGTDNAGTGGSYTMYNTSGGGMGMGGMAGGCGGAPLNLVGDAARNLTTPIDTSTGSVSVDFSLAYMADSLPADCGDAVTLSLEAYDSATTNSSVLWTTTTPVYDRTWYTAAGTVVINTGISYDQIRVVFNIRGRDGGLRTFWVDEIQLNYTVGAANWKVVTWTPVDGL